MNIKCLICKKNFILKRAFKDLLSCKKAYVCDKCVKENPIKIQFNYLPLTNHQLEIVSLFEKPYLNYDAFIIEYSQIYQLLATRNKPIYLYDSFVLKEQNLLEFDYLATQLDDDIIILTNTYID